MHLKINIKTTFLINFSSRRVRPLRLNSLAVIIFNKKRSTTYSHDFRQMDVVQLIAVSQCQLLKVWNVVARTEWHVKIWM